VVDRGLGPERLLEMGGLPDASLRVAGPADAGAPEAARVFAVVRSEIAALPAGAYSAAGLAAALDDLRGRVGRVYLHVDLDALDPAEGIANRYAAPGGLSAGQVRAALAAVGDRFEVAAAAVTAYEPAADADGRMAATAVRIIAALAQLGTA
jgi:arginase